MLSWQHITKHFKCVQLVRPQSGIRVWLVKWPLLGISVGEDLFLVVPTWRWDNRSGQHVLCLMTILNIVLILKNVKRPSFWKEKCKKVLIPDSETNQGELQLVSENALNKVRLGAWPFLQRGQKPLSSVLPKPFPSPFHFGSHVVWAFETPSPIFWWNPISVDWILTESSMFPLALGQLELNYVHQSQTTNKKLFFMYLNEKKYLLDPKQKKWANMRLI